jgi:hypothetical protein
MSRVSIEQPRGDGHPAAQMLQWMPAPGLANPTPGMPLGLYYLAQIDTLTARQEASVMQSI